VRDGRIVIIDPTGERPDEDTGQFAGDALVAAEARIGRFNRNSRWPQLAEPFEQTSRTVEVMVHDAAEARRGAMAISADGALFAGGFAVGLKGAQRLEPVLGIWDATTGAIDGLLRFVDDAVVDSDAPATTVALSRNGQTAIEARPGGVLIVWNVAERRYVHLIQSDVGEVTQLIPSTAGDDLLVVGGGTGLELWSLGDDPPQRRWRVPLAGLTAAAIAPDSSAIAVAAAGQVELLDATDGAARFTFQPGERVRFLDFAPRGGRLMLGGVIYSSAL
jgi:hypothetical protein